MSCNTCRWACFEDYGYSNYTVEGTTFTCLKKLHPADGFDRFYGTDKRLDFGITCGGYESGDPAAASVEDDRPTSYYDEVEQLLISQKET